MTKRQHNAIMRAVFTAASDTNRNPMLEQMRAVKWERRGQRVIATDGYRIHIAHPIEGINLPSGVYVPPTDSDNRDDWPAGFLQKWARARSLKFPDWRSVMPNPEATTPVSVNVADAIYRLEEIPYPEGGDMGRLVYASCDDGVWGPEQDRCGHSRRDRVRDAFLLMQAAGVKTAKQWIPANGRGGVLLKGTGLVKVAAVWLSKKKGV